MEKMLMLCLLLWIVNACAAFEFQQQNEGQGCKSILMGHFQPFLFVKADSHTLHLMCAAAADGCVSAEIVNFIFFHTTHFCLSHAHQMKLV